jgi:hypothetical protein
MIDFKKYWNHSDDEPLSQLVIDNFYGEVGAGEGGYWGFIITPEKEQIDPPPEINNQQTIQAWVEETVDKLIQERAAKEQVTTGKAE